MAKVKPSLFISYASEDVAAAEALSDALKEEFDVFRDREKIRGTDKWRSKIELALLYCQVGLVLTSENSVESPWVQAEAQMLGFRKRVTDPAMRVLPVFLDGYDPEELQKGDWQPSGLYKFQGMPLDTRNAATQESHIQDIVELLLPWAEELAERRPELEAVERYLEVRLKGLECVEELAEILQFEFTSTQMFLNQARWLACRLLRVQDLDAFNDVIMTIKVLGKSDETESETLARGLVEQLASYCWIDPDVASALQQEVLSDKRPRTTVGLVARKPRTPRACVQRASQRVVKPWRVWPVNASWDHDALDFLIGEVMSHIERANIAAQDSVVDDDLRKELERYSRQKGEVVVLLPKEFAEEDNDLLEELRTSFQHLTFLLATEGEMPELSQRFDDFRPLPPLDAKLEEDADSTLGTLEKEVGLLPPDLPQP